MMCPGANFFCLPFYFFIFSTVVYDTLTAEGLESVDKFDCFTRVVQVVLNACPLSRDGAKFLDSLIR